MNKKQGQEYRIVGKELRVKREKSDNQAAGFSTRLPVGKFNASWILYTIYLLSVIFLFNGPVCASIGNETSRNVAAGKTSAVNNAVMNEKIEETQQASRHDTADSAVPDYADAESEGIIYQDEAGVASPEKGSEKDKPHKKPNRINYTGPDPKSYVRVYRDGRTDAPPMYTTNFKVKTAKRLKTIEVSTGRYPDGNVVRAYRLEYDGYSIGTGRSLLRSVKQFGNNVTVDGNGVITGESTMPAVTFEYAQVDVPYPDWQPWSDGFGDIGNKMVTGDFNGDGKDDLAFCNDYKTWIGISDGLGSINWQLWSYNIFEDIAYKVRTGDFNGDGKSDLAFWDDGRTWIGISDGLGSINWQQWSYEGFGDIGDKIVTGDFNEDGKSDLAFYNDSATWIGISNGVNYIDWQQRSYDVFGDIGKRVRTGDFNGDGKSDLAFCNDSATMVAIITPLGIPDILKTVSNNRGATVTLDYEPSSTYTNIKLPFIVQTLLSVTVNDGNGISSTTYYDYQGGNFDAADREYRGFEYMWVTAPDGTYTESMYYVDDNEDILKGRIREQTTRDSSNNIYTRTENYYSYTSPYTGVNFPYLYQKDDFVYDGTPEFKKGSAAFEYDDYGNVTRKHLEGDVSITGDERDEYTYYAPYDTANWIVALPKGSYITDSDGYTVAQEWFAYDSKGNMLTRESWLEDGSNPVTSYTYDSYGNINTVTDPRGYQSTITTEYLENYIQVVAENTLGHTVIKKIDYGYGKVIEETDPNGYTTTYEYDEFGRVAKIIGPKDTAAIPSMKFEYLNLGTIGGAVPENDQKVKTCALKAQGVDNYLCKEAYFDGLGRTFRTESDGPDSKVIVAETIYNDRGLVSQRSFPYFKDGGIKKYTTFEYDPIGRNTITTYPDGNKAKLIYSRPGTLTAIDPNGHQRVEIKDIYGRVIEVREYTGTHPDAVLYATTIYGYDPLGNLEYVRDALGNETYMVYDTLSRKTAMYDPDMGL